MEIRKIQEGWEYNHIVFNDEMSAQIIKEATEKVDRNRSFGRFIERILKDQNKCIGNLASDINVSRQTLFLWMNGESVPSRKKIETIIRVTKCPINEIKMALKDNFEMQKLKLFKGLKDT